MKIIFILLILFAVVVTSTMAISGGNSYRGRMLVKKICKPCHASEADINLLSPSSKIMAQWDRFFIKGKHPGTVIADLSEADKTDIWQFMFQYAADTDQPQSCTPHY